MGWSPDGQQIVYNSEKGDPRGTASYGDPSTAEIYVIQADGSNLRKLTDNRAIDLCPSWSPDGKHIAFYSNRDRDLNYTGDKIFSSKGPGAFQIYIMQADGQQVQRLTNTTANDITPAWSPDGSRIAFASDRDGNLEIYVMNADGSQPTRLTDLPGLDLAPVWNPVITP